MDYTLTLNTHIRNGILPKDLIAEINKNQDIWNNYLSFLNGITLNDTVELKDNLIIGFTGNYSGSYKFMDKDILLEGTNPYTVYKDNEFKVLYSVKYDTYPKGTVLPFIINIPEGWSKLNIQDYIEIGDANLDTKPSSQMPVSLSGSLYGSMDINTSNLQWDNDQASLNGDHYSAPRLMDYYVNLKHGHNIKITNKDKTANNPEPKHINIIYGEKIQ